MELIKEALTFDDVTLAPNYSEILPMLEYCLERNIELRFIELMRMGHLATGNSFARDFVSID